MKKKYDVRGMMCAACQANVARAVSKIDGVESANVSLLGKSMVVEFDESKVDDQTIISGVESAGYGCSIYINESVRQIQAKREKALAASLRNVLWSLGFLALLMVFSMGPMIPPVMAAIDASPYMPFICFGNVTAQLVLLVPIFILNRAHFVSGFRALGKLHPNMDSLVALGSTAATLYGLYIYASMIVALASSDAEAVMRYSMNIYFESAAMIPTFISLGKYFEARATSKTTASIASLMALTPDVAIVLRGGEETEVQTEAILEDETVVIKPGMTIPVDGVVLSGYGSVDQSAISGESVPVYKKEGDKVVAGTTNKEGSFLFRVTEVGRDTTISKIVDLVQEASDSKAPMARLADRISAIFVPSVIVISLITFTLWMLLSGFGVVSSSRPDWNLSIQLAVSVLVISCPCALGLATPVAIMVGTGIGAEHGILIKSAEAFERSSKVDVVLFDKTGTLTKGEMRVKDFLVFNEDVHCVLSDVAGVESCSEHPISKAIVRYAKEQGIEFERSLDFENVPGKGVRGSSYAIGNLPFALENGSVGPKVLSELEQRQEAGETALVIMRGNQAIGLISVTDEAKKHARAAVESLKKMGKQVAMVTGDNEKTARAIASNLGIDEVHAGVLPDQKEQIVRHIQESGRSVAFVGDGINDAPALTRADVGVAIGAGTEIAIESSDIVLGRNDPLDVASAFALSAKVVRNIKQNLTWAFLYNVILIPLAAGAFYAVAVEPNWFTGSQAHLVLTPMIGSFAMSLSSVTVVLNALRLRFFKGIQTKEE